MLNRLVLFISFSNHQKSPPRVVQVLTAQNSNFFLLAQSTQNLPLITLVVFISL